MSIPSASELRCDPVTGRTVILARGRAERPHDFRRPLPQRVDRPCPFCRGHERETPPPLAEYGGDGVSGRQQDWLVRVIPNKYAALSWTANAGSANDGPAGDEAGNAGVQAEGTRAGAARGTEPPLFPPAKSGCGAHEVIVESPRHVTCFSQLSPEEATLTLLACRDRMRVHAQHPQLRYAQVFKNTGVSGGASVEHVHSQLIATTFVPPLLQRELAGAYRFFLDGRQCVYCAMSRWEQVAKERMVLETSRFVAFCPYASRFPYEAWILPRRHEAHFHHLEDEALGELAALLRALIAGMIRASGQGAYNYLLHTAPFDTFAADHYHWHIELLPRASEIAGFEWATGCFINAVFPETASQAMRETAQSFLIGKTS